MQGQGTAGMHARQSRPERLREQVLVAVPGALVVERDDEQVAALELLEHGAAVAASGEGVAECAGHLVEHGGRHEEVSNPVGLSAEHLLDQVVQDETVAAGKGIDAPQRVNATAHRQRCELQPSRPAFGPRIQGQDVVRAEIQTHELVEKRLGLARG